MNLDLCAAMTMDLLMHFRGKAEIVSLIPMEADMGVPFPVFCEDNVYWQIPFFLSEEKYRVWLGIAVMNGVTGELSSYWKIEGDSKQDQLCARGDFWRESLAEHIKAMLRKREAFSDGNSLRAYLQELSEKNYAYTAITPLCLRILKIYRDEVGK